jgi:hypothetical protein
LKPYEIVKSFPQEVAVKTDVVAWLTLTPGYDRIGGRMGRLMNANKANIKLQQPVMKNSSKIHLQSTTCFIIMFHLCFG